MAGRCYRDFTRLQCFVSIVFCTFLYYLYRMSMKSERSPRFQSASDRNFFASSPLMVSSYSTSSLRLILSQTNQTNHYLTLINAMHGELSLGNVSEKTKRRVEDFIRSGYGLEPYTTERGEAGWSENGMVYRPWRKPDHSTVHKKYPSPHTAEYELYIPFNEKAFFEGRRPDENYKADKKIILWHQKTRYTKPKYNLRPMQHCPDFPCYITTNKKYRDNSSAMIFTAQIMSKTLPMRTSDQVFILHNNERPFVKDLPEKVWADGFLQPRWKQVFNWTMTYRTDSDIFVPYGVIRKRPTPVLNKNYQAIVNKKTKLVAWFVGNCHPTSKREQYVNELQKYIPVDIYGACGTMNCPRSMDDKCLVNITDTYKFYLSFENSICPDYITEKMFRYLTMDTVIVVRGGNQYFIHAPRELFLNTADFPSPKELAERMLYLHNNDSAYTEMLREKDKYVSIFEDYPLRTDDGNIYFMEYRFESAGLCQVCQRLWNLDKYAKIIPDIHKWFNEKICAEPTDLETERERER